MAEGGGAGKGEPVTNGVPQPIIKRGEPIPDWPRVTKYQFVYDLDVDESAHVEISGAEERVVFRNRVSSVIRNHSRRTGKKFVVRSTGNTIGIWRIE